MKLKSESEVAQSCLTLRDPMDCSPPGSSIHGIFQARVLEWGAIAFSAQESFKEGSRRVKVRERAEDISLPALKMKEPQARKCRQHLEAGKGRETESPLQSPERTMTLPIP